MTSIGNTPGKTPPQPASQPSILSFFSRKPSYASPPGLPTTKSTENASSPPPPANPSTASIPNPNGKPPSSPALHTTPGSDATLSAPPKSQDSSPPGTPYQICTISPEHVQPLRRINSLLLPIPYPDSFYNRLTASSDTENFSRVVTYNSPSEPPKVVGGIVCRIDTLPSENASPTVEIYVQSLAVLSPYREKGLGSKLLAAVVAAAGVGEGEKVEGLYAHVWTDNKEALQWYMSRGFRKEDAMIPNYYRRLNPSTAWVLRRKLTPSDLLSSLPFRESPTAAKPATGGPPKAALRPAAPVHTSSFQDRRPEREWNDLPEDVKLSAASSRSSSRSGPDKETKGKKKRAYPAAAFTPTG